LYITEMGTVQNKSTAVPVLGIGSKKYLGTGTRYFAKYIAITTGVARNFDGGGK